MPQITSKKQRTGLCCNMPVTASNKMKLLLMIAIFVCVFEFASITMVGIAKISFRNRHRLVVVLGGIGNSGEIGAHHNKSYLRFVDAVGDKRHQLEHQVSVQHSAVHQDNDFSNTEATKSVNRYNNNNSHVESTSIKAVRIQGGMSKDEIIETSENVDIYGNVFGSTNSTRQSKCDRCFEHNFKYVIQNEHICNQKTPDQKIYLLILITTTHQHVNARLAIRKTWLSYTNNNTGDVRYAFLLGETPNLQYKKLVEEENILYRDMIKEDFVDVYRNLTYKTIMGYKWAATRCAIAENVMKTDDDMYVNVPDVKKLINTVNKSVLQTTILGFCSQKAIPNRSVKSKWYASTDSYPDTTYPGFCSGTGYVTSMNVARKVYEISPNVPFFHLEDVYVSLCLSKLGFHLKSIKGFNPERVKLDPCIYKNNMTLTSHRLSPDMLMSIWKMPCSHKRQ